MAANTYSVDLESSSSQYLSITDASQTGLDLTTDFTLEAWIKLEQLPSTAGSNFRIIAKDDVNVSRAYSFGILSTNDKLVLEFFSDNTTVSQFTCDTAFDSGDVGSWVHVAVSVDISAPSVTFYIDSSAKADTAVQTNSTTIQNSSTPFQIGARRQSGSVEQYFDGLIDEGRVWNDIRTPTEILNNYNLELEGTETNLQGYWKLNNSLLDETSNNNDLTNNNSATFNTDIPFSNETNSNSTDLESISSQHWEKTSPSGLPTSGNRTFEVYGKFESLPSTGGLMFLVDVGDEASNEEMGIALQNSSGTYYLFTDVFNRGVQGPAWTPTVGTWYHIAMTYDGADFEWYVDGVSQGTATAGTIATTGNAKLRVGTRILTTGFGWFDGKIDEVRIWNDVRTATEISDNYEKELEGDETGLVAYYQFNGDGDDLTSNSNDLTSNGGAAFNGDVPFVGSTGTVVEPTAISYAMTVNTPTVTGKATVSPTAVSYAMTIPTPTVTGGANVTPTAIEYTMTIPTPGTSAGIIVNATAISYTMTIPTPVVSACVCAFATAIPYSMTIPTPTVKFGWVETPTAIGYTMTIPDPVVRIKGWINLPKSSTSWANSSKSSTIWTNLSKN